MKRENISRTSIYKIYSNEVKKQKEEKVKRLVIAPHKQVKNDVEKK